jgi:hypothetical protein
MTEPTYKKIDIETGEESVLDPTHPFVTESKAFDAEHGAVYRTCRECGSAIRSDKHGELFDHYLIGFRCKGSGSKEQQGATMNSHGLQTEITEDWLRQTGFVYAEHGGGNPKRCWQLGCVKVATASKAGKWNALVSTDMDDNNAPNVEAFGYATPSIVLQLMELFL